MSTDCIAILYNPLAGKNKANAIADEIAEVLSMKNIQFFCFKDWPKKLDRFTEVWIVGGDGTLNYFINQYPNCKIPLSIFKGGTGNDFSWKLYGNISVNEQVEKVLTTTAKFVDAAVCNEKLYINSLGIGFDGEVLKSMKSVRNFGGHLGYLFIVLKKVFNFKEFEFEINTDSISIKNKLLIVMINNNTRTGGGFMVTPAAKVNDGMLDMFLCNKLNILQRLKTLSLVEKGRESSHFRRYQINSTIINVSQNVYASLDGELIEAEKFVINVLPKKFLFKY